MAADILPIRPDRDQAAAHKITSAIRLLATMTTDDLLGLAAHAVANRGEIDGATALRRETVAAAGNAKLWWVALGQVDAVIREEDLRPPSAED